MPHNTALEHDLDDANYIGKGAAPSGDEEAKATSGSQLNNAAG